MKLPKGRHEGNLPSGAQSAGARDHILFCDAALEEPIFQGGVAVEILGERGVSHVAVQTPQLADRRVPKACNAMPYALRGANLRCDSNPGRPNFARAASKSAGRSAGGVGTRFTSGTGMRRRFPFISTGRPTRNRCPHRAPRRLCLSRPDVPLARAHRFPTTGHEPPSPFTVCATIANSGAEASRLRVA